MKSYIVNEKHILREKRRQLWNYLRLHEVYSGIKNDIDPETSRERILDRRDIIIGILSELLEVIQKVKIPQEVLDFKEKFLEDRLSLLREWDDLLARNGANVWNVSPGRMRINVESLKAKEDFFCNDDIKMIEGYVEYSQLVSFSICED